MKKYTRPELDISLFSCEAIVTESSSTYTQALTDWKANNTGAQLTKANMTELQNVVKFTF